MDDVLLMQVFQTKESLPQHVLHRILTISRVELLDDLREGTTVHELHKDPQASLVIIAVKNLKDNLVVFAHIHKTNLIKHELSILLVLQILDKLEGQLLAVGLPRYSENFAVPALAELVLRVDLVEL